MLTCNVDNCPIGVLNEFDLVSRYPDRKAEIIHHAIDIRERRLTMTSETRRLLSWHPIHTVKIIFVSGLATFVIVWLLSQIAQVGHWYADLKALGIAIPFPVIGEKTLDLGSHIPTSTTLATAAQLPVLSLKNSFVSALLVMCILVLERIVATVVQWKKIQNLKLAEHELEKEIQTLQSWTT